MTLTYHMEYLLAKDEEIKEDVIQEFDYKRFQENKRIRTENKKMYEEYVKYEKKFISRNLMKEVNRLNLKLVHIKEKVEVWNRYIKVRFKIDCLAYVTSYIYATVTNDRDYKEILNKLKRDIVLVDSKKMIRQCSFTGCDSAHEEEEEEFVIDC